jgi:glycosyltransferase involved in cell wall biosynthesis
VNYLEKIVYEFQILAETLSRLGHEVVVVDYDDTWDQRGGPWLDLRTTVYEAVHRAYPDACVTVRRPGMIRVPILSRISAAVTTAIEVWKTLGSGVDVVLLYGVPSVGWQTVVAARLAGVPVLFRSIDVLHRLVPYRVLVPVARLLERIVYRRADRIIAVTPRLREYVLSFGVETARVEVLPSGVDTALFSPGPRDDALMAEWGIRPADPVMLFMGTIYRFSGLDWVIAGLSALLRRHPGAKLFVAGIGVDEDRLKELAHKAGVAKSVVWAGMQPFGGLPALIRAATVCINPFELNAITRDILPTKLFQYLACGRPVVATELPGTLAFLRGEEHGIVYASLDRFVDRVAEVMENPAQRERLGAAGVAAARGYEWRRIAEKLVSIAEHTRG